MDDKIKVLAVDDNVSIHKMLESLLEQEGYFILHAEDGKEGVRVAKKDQPDIILMDVSMPEMDGFEALAHLKNDPKTSHIPVIMLTFEQQHEAVEKGIRNSADHYIPKPFEPEDLLAAIKQSLSRSNS